MMLGLHFKSRYKEKTDVHDIENSETQGRIQRATSKAASEKFEQNHIHPQSTDTQDDDLRSEAVRIMQKDGKISAIKYVKTTRNMSLVDAKNYVDSL